MKANRSAWILSLLFFGVICFQLIAQPSNEAVTDLENVKTLANAGNVDAEYLLGLLYYHGRGTAKDLVEGVKWIRKAAEEGNADAQTDLGGCYDSGEGVSKDSVEAVKWYRKAAEQGNARAQSNLSSCY